MRPRTFTDEELLAAARRCFLEHGPSVATSKIASEIGVSQAALFKRFKTKSELMVRALTPACYPEWMDEIEQGPTDAPVRGQLLEIARSIDRTFEQLMPCVSILRAADISPTDHFERFPEPPPTRAHRLITSWFEKLQKEGRLPGNNPAAVATAFLGGLQARHFMTHAMDYPEAKGGPDYVEQYISIFWDGIGPREKDGGAK